MAMMVKFGILALSSPGLIICGIVSLIGYFHLKSKVDKLAKSDPAWYINTN